MTTDDNTLRGLVKGAYDLLEFGHDPVNGSWQIPPDAESVHMAGALLKDALVIIDRIVDDMITEISAWKGVSR